MSEFYHRMKRHLALRAVAPLDALFGSRAEGTVGVLMYHRVTERCVGASVPTWNVTPERFRQQLRGLLARGFRAWPLRKVIDCGRRGAPVPARTFVVTFDDGYESVYRNAWPVLRELRVPATVFLATAFLDSGAPFPFDDWPAAGSPRVAAHAWRPLNAAQCHAMAADGLVELGAHTHTHADFRGRPHEFERDLSQCVELLRERFGLTEVSFAFPYGVRRLGYSSPELVDAARRAGVLCSLTTEPRLLRPASDPYSWGRYPVSHAESGATLAAYLNGWFNLVREARQGWRLGSGGC